MIHTISIDRNSSSRLPTKMELSIFPRITRFSTSWGSWKSIERNAKSRVIIKRPRKLEESLRSFSEKRRLDKRTILEQPKNKNCKTSKRPKKLNSLNSHKLGTTTCPIMRLLPTCHSKSSRKSTCSSSSSSKKKSEKSYEQKWSSQKTCWNLETEKQN